MNENIEAHQRLEVRLEDQNKKIWIGICFFWLFQRDKLDTSCVHSQQRSQNLSQWGWDSSTNWREFEGSAPRRRLSPRISFPHSQVGICKSKFDQQLQSKIASPRNSERNRQSERESCLLSWEIYTNKVKVGAWAEERGEGNSPSEEVSSRVPRSLDWKSGLKNTSVPWAWSISNMTEIKCKKSSVRWLNHKF